MVLERIFKIGQPETRTSFYFFLLVTFEIFDGSSLRLTLA
jgi:hypothetical protein